MRRWNKRTLSTEEREEADRLRLEGIGNGSSVPTPRFAVRAASKDFRVCLRECNLCDISTAKAVFSKTTLRACKSFILAWFCEPRLTIQSRATGSPCQALGQPAPS